MKYDFDIPVDRTLTQSVKWSKQGILPLWVADMDFPCPDPLVEALSSRAQTRIFGYTHLGEEYPGILRAWNMDRYGWAVREEDIFYSPGVMASIACLVRCLTGEGAGIIIQPPVYPYFKRIIEANGRKTVENALVASKGQYHMDFADLEEKAREKGTAMMILCSPHNPVGRVWDREELVRVANICRDNHVILVSDEIHADIIRRDRTFIPVDKACPWEGIITCTAPSKTFNMPGLMFSNVVIRDAGYKGAWKMEAYGKSGLSMPNPFGYSAAVAAYTLCGDWLEQVNAYIDRNLLFMRDNIREAGCPVTYRIPEGTYLAWMDFNGYGLADEELEDRIHGKAGVRLNKGTEFHEGATGFFRLNAACPRIILEEALSRIFKALE
ncbi:MAG: PatB family C-S lyase [Clostridia bacterium]